MSDLLQVIIDFNIDKLCQNYDNQINGCENKVTPLEILLDSLIKFLNAFQISSALNRYKVYLALPNSCKLIFPIEDSTDSSNLQRFAFENVRDTIYQRVFDVIKEMSEKQTSSRTAISQAFLKAICHANKTKIQQKVLVSSEMVNMDMISSRILFIQMDKDDPTQYPQMVNGIFAAQKLNITIDAIILKETLQEFKENELSKKAETKTPYLLIQASQQTKGVFRELPGTWYDAKYQGSMLFFELINNFLPSPSARRNVLRIPNALSLEQVKMSSTCICHNQVISIGYACSNCLSLHCFHPFIDQLKELDQDKKEFKKLKQESGQEKNYIQQKSYPKLKEMEEKGHVQCKKCEKKFSQQ